MEQWTRELQRQIGALLDPARIEQFVAQWQEQVQVRQTATAWVVEVAMESLQKPEDMSATLVGDAVHLRRNVQRRTRIDRQEGVFESMTVEQFHRVIPLPASARWEKRSISCQPGRWTLTLPTA